MTGEPLRCRLLGHDWQVWYASADGHQSRRERRCLRCLRSGLLVTETQGLSYYLNRTSKWGDRKIRPVRDRSRA